MATGDIVLFEEFVAQLGGEVHDLANDEIKVGLIDNVVTPTASDATPRWGAGSGVDYDANEVGTGGNYTSGGEVLANSAYTETDGVGKFDADNLSFAQDASGFTDAYWGIIFNEDAANNEAIGYIELGGPPQ